MYSQAKIGEMPKPSLAIPKLKKDGGKTWTEWYKTGNWWVMLRHEINDRPLPTKEFLGRGLYGTKCYRFNWKIRRIIASESKYDLFY